MTPIKSSTISHIAYNDDIKIMTVRFNSGTMYDYYDVSEKEYNKIVKSVSPGSTLREITKGKEYKKL